LIEAEKLSALGRYAAGIVHNLNNPLQLLMGYAELIKIEDPDNPYIEAQLKAAQSIKEMIATILSNCSMKSNTTKVEIDFNQLLKDLVEIMTADQFFKHHVQKIFNLQPLPGFMGVYAHFDQVFGNLLKNAVEAMHASERCELKIETKCARGRIDISISDSGQGIRQEEMDKIFDPFYTTKPLVAENGTPCGTGLGLASTKEMIESYNGKITVDSEFGKGSVFRIQIPIPNWNNKNSRGHFDEYVN
jgi:signal transduction histidine kinase